MNKFAKLFAGMAVISLAASCSSDEPMGTTGGNDNAEGSLYMVVSIQDAADMSRADVNDRTEDGEYEYGTNEGENNIASARFLFFDANGLFYAESNPVITEGSSTNGNYIEYQTKTQIVLEGQKDRSLPCYLLTVLNGNGFTVAPGATLESVHNQLQSIRNNGNFVMSTSSFIPADGDTKYNAKYPYVNVIKSSDFYTEPVQDIEAITPVDVYVERLATKLTVSFENGNKAQEVKVTLAGDDNNEGGNNTGIKSLYVTLDGFGVTNVEKQSYLSKHILGFENSALEGWEWNKFAHYRSFWGKSTQYDNGTPDLARLTFDQADGNFSAVYSYETTNTFDNIKGAGETPRVKNGMVPCAVFAATISVDQNGTTEDLVMFNGVLFKESHFIKYILAALQGEEKGLNFYTLSDNEYTQVDSKYVEVGRNWEKPGAACELHANKTALDGVTLYEKVGEKEYKQIENTTIEKEIDGKMETITLSPADQLTQRLREYTSKPGNTAEAYKGGRSTYVIPIRHLRGLSSASNGSYVVTAEGQYGMVRNHHYELVLDKITKIGSGVFNPGSDTVPGDTIPTDNPQDDTYGLGAKINILSWKIVKQNVNL